VLLLLDEQPRNGYQLMQAIEERSEGRWRPSPGSVYPALAQLEDQGLVRATELDGARVFEITDAGREHVESRAAAHPPWDGDPDPEGEAFGDIRKLLGQVAVAAMQVTQAGDQNQLERAGTVLADTRRALYRILAEEDDD
jgi:DNA-binding PadR family transcriptional regulator